MKHSKHLKPGMSLIEVIAAIAILAIFGSSLFLMQQFLFDRMMMTQRKVIANLNMQAELAVYQANILKELFEDAGPVEKSLEERVTELSNPDMTIKITTQSNLASSADQKENGFKSFKNLHILSVQAEHDAIEYGKSYLFMYIPEVVKK